MLRPSSSSPRCAWTSSTSAPGGRSARASAAKGSRAGCTRGKDIDPPPTGPWRLVGRDAWGAHYTDRVSDGPPVIHVAGAREHNLRDVSVDIPRDALTVITGLSGSGKSSLAFDTLYAEGQRRYVESLSAYARQFLGQMDKPDVDHIEG